MIRDIICLTAVLFAACLAAPSAARADGKPDLKISTLQKKWKESEVIRTRGTARDLYLRLKNESNGDGETKSHTFTLNGPSGGTDWDITYYHSGAQKTVPFDISLDEGETTIVRAHTAPLASPDAYLWANKSHGSAFTLSGNGSVDRAGAVAVVPGDLRILERNEGIWVGNNIVLDPRVDIWSSAQQVPANSPATDGAAIYHIALENVKNATVSYRLKVQPKADTAASLQVCWRTNSRWEAQQDITSTVTSATGKTVGPLNPGVVRYYKLYVVPVGSNDSARAVAVSAAVDEVDGLGGLNEMKDLVPIAAQMENLPPEGGTFDMYGPANAGTLKPGNFGLLDFDGGSNPVGEVENWLEDREDLSVPDDSDHVWVYGSPGYKAAIRDELSGLVGQTLNVPVSTDARGTGANTQFKMKGYAQVVLEPFSHGNPATATFEWVSFFHMPMLTEAVICNTGRPNGLEMGTWEEISPMQYEQ